MLSGQQMLANEVNRKITELQSAAANSPEARKLVKEIYLLFTNGKTEGELSLAFLSELAKYDGKDNTLVIEALKKRASVINHDTLTVNDLEKLVLNEHDVDRVNSVLQKFNITPITESDSQEEQNKKIILEAIILAVINKILLEITDAGTNLVNMLPNHLDLIGDLNTICKTKVGA